MRGLGRAIFVAILLLIAGTLNVVYGIAAVSNAHFFNSTQFVFSTSTRGVGSRSSLASSSSAPASPCWAGEDSVA